jgi:hypothetical protein
MSTTENLGERVSKWLVQEGFSVEPVNSPDYLSLYRAIPKSNPEDTLSVSQAASEDRVVIARGFKISDGDRALLAKLPPQMRAAMRNELAVLLNGASPLFRMEESDGILEQLSLSRPIYADGLTKDRLMTAITELYKTQALIMLRIGEYFRTAVERAPSSSRSTPTGSRPASKKRSGGHVSR